MPEPLGVFGGSVRPRLFFLEPEGRSRVPQQNRQKMGIVKNPIAGEFSLELAILAEDFGSWIGDLGDLG